MSVELSKIGFFHSVYFYPRDDFEPGDAEALLAGCRKWLPEIPTVASFAMGTPAGTTREVVDNSYIVALLVGFEDDAAEAAYQVHPNHLRFIEENQQYWSKATVFDTLI